MTVESDRVRSKRATIRDVAEEANVAISTVSLVMNDKGYVSEETRLRVQSAAQRLGYRPRQAARELVLRRTGNIGFVLRSDHFTHREPFYTRIFLGTEFEAHNHNQYVLLTTIPRHYEPEVHLPRFLRDLSVDGVLVAGRVDGVFLEHLATFDLPAVLVDFEAEGFPAVVIDNRAGSRQAVDHLLERGHRRIAFLGADMDHPSLTARREGYQLALAKAGVEVLPELQVVAPLAEPDHETGVELVDRLCAIDPRPTAVFCGNDALAMGVVSRAIEMGINVPGDLAVVGFDDVPWAEKVRPSLTTVRVLKEQMGELAARYLADLTEDLPRSRAKYERGSHTIRVPTELVVREST
jgi:LacI family transcriptional regulator